MTPRDLWEARKRAWEEGAESERNRICTILTDDVDNIWDWDDRMRKLADMFAKEFRSGPLPPFPEEPPSEPATLIYKHHDVDPYEDEQS